MELSLLLLEQILAMMVMVLAGVALAKAGVLNGRESQIISRVVIYILTPCALLDGFLTPMDWNKLEGLLAALVASVLIHGRSGGWPGYWGGGSAPSPRGSRPA